MSESNRWLYSKLLLCNSLPVIFEQAESVSSGSGAELNCSFSLDSLDAASEESDHSSNDCSSLITDYVREQENSSNHKLNSDDSLQQLEPPVFIMTTDESIKKFKPFAQPCSIAKEAFPWPVEESSSQACCHFASAECLYGHISPFGTSGCYHPADIRRMTKCCGLSQKGANISVLRSDRFCENLVRMAPNKASNNFLNFEQTSQLSSDGIILTQFGSLTKPLGLFNVHNSFRDNDLFLNDSCCTSANVARKCCAHSPTIYESILQSRNSKHVLGVMEELNSSAEKLLYEEDGLSSNISTDSTAAAESMKVHLKRKISGAIISRQKKSRLLTSISFEQKDRSGRSKGLRYLKSIWAKFSISSKRQGDR